MGKTDLYCTNCNKEFEPYEEVTEVHGSIVLPFLGDHHVQAGDSPSFQVLCKTCASVLQVEPAPNRVVIELRRGLFAECAILGIRAERPDDVCVIVKDYLGEEGIAYGPGRLPIGTLFTEEG